MQVRVDARRSLDSVREVIRHSRERTSTRRTVNLNGSPCSSKDAWIFASAGLTDLVCSGVKYHSAIRLSVRDLRL